MSEWAELFFPESSSDGLGWENRMCPSDETISGCAEGHRSGVPQWLIPMGLGTPTHPSPPLVRRSFLPLSTPVPMSSHSKCSAGPLPSLAPDYSF
jgi:hypothetical protein